MYSPQVTQRIEKGVIRRTVCCWSFGIFRLGIFDGSKSGGKYLFSTFRSDLKTHLERLEVVTVLQLINEVEALLHGDVALLAKYEK